jgi:hypothetical protein
MARNGKEGQLLQAKLLFFPRKEKHFVEEKKQARINHALCIVPQL